MRPIALRVYQSSKGKAGDSAIILLGGGAKRTQSMDIRPALAIWADYKTAIDDE